MKKMFLTLLLTVMATAGMNAQLLYKISGKGLRKPSYIIGTYHLAPVSFVDSIPGLRSALAESEQVYGEIETADMTSPENIAKMQQAMMLPEGKTLTELLTPEQMQKLNATMKELLGVDMSNPMVAQQMNKMLPQALVTQLTVIMYLKKHSGFNPTQSFDDYFQQQAVAQGKPVGGFETMDFQLQALFGSISIERQIELLMCFLNNREWEESQVDNIVEAFFAQDLNRIEAAMDEKQDNSCDATDEENELLIYGRNATWLKKMPEIMQQKSTFFAVGAAHLAGERGVLAGLRNAGYLVEGINH
jgi:uncharacterized protein YbaP (TraB family)